MSIELDIQVARYMARKVHSCAARGIEFALPFASVRNMFKAKYCYYTGTPLTNDNRSIDRVDSSKGYVVGNVVACDKRFNTAKGNLTPAQLKLIQKGFAKKGVV